MLIVRYDLPHSDLASLPPSELQAKMERGEPLEFSHSLEDQIGGQIEAGFVIRGFYEDRWFDDAWLLSTRSPVAGRQGLRRLGSPGSPLPRSQQSRPPDVIPSPS